MTPQEPADPRKEDSGLLRVQMQLSYDGAPFSGWAIQPGRLTVQGVIEDALRLLLQRPVRVTVAGRTDAGVHARGQVIHCDLTEAEWMGLSRGKDLEPGVALRRRLRGIMNRTLQHACAGPQTGPGSFGAASAAGAIEVHQARLAPAGFDARFSALSRRYSYLIADDAGSWDPLNRATTLWHRHQLDTDLMNRAVQPLLGLQDFRAFCRLREGATTIRELQRFEFVRRPDGVIAATIQSDAFCHNMVRGLIGAVLQVGSGARDAQWLQNRLLAKVRDAQATVAPAHPLVLEEVHYPDDAGVLERAESTRARRSGFSGDDGSGNS